MEAPRGVVLKSVHGVPAPVYPPPGVDLAKEARTARSHFYPVTVLYSAYFLVRTTRIPAADRVRLYGHAEIRPFASSRGVERRSA